jgi:hypothetical protein
MDNSNNSSTSNSSASNSNTSIWVLVIGILLILGLSAFGLIWFVRDSVQKTISPVQSMTGDLGTAVSEVLNPTPTVLPNPVTVIRDVRTLARLETIEYRIEKVIKAEVGQGLFGELFGDKLIFVAHGIVIAGTDLAKFGPEHMELKDGVLYVRLPDPEVFIATLDNEKSYVYDRDTGLLTHGDVNLETTARREAEKEIENAAVEDGILEQAGQNTEYYLERLLNSLGYPEVVFIRDFAPSNGE